MSLRTNRESHDSSIENGSPPPSLLQSIAAGIASQYRKLCEPSPQKRRRHGYRPGIEQLEDRRMLSAVPLDFSMLSNTFAGDVAAEVSVVESGHENVRMQIANEELVMGVRDSLVSQAEFQPSAEKPLTVSMKARFVNQDSLYVFTRSEGSTAVGGYRSANEVRVELDMAAKALRIYESQGGSLSIIGQQANLDLPMHEDLDVTLVDDGTTVTVTVGQYSVSGETTGSYSGFKTGVSNWSGRTVVDDYVIRHGTDTMQDGTDEANGTDDTAANTEEVDTVFADLGRGAWNPFDNNTVDSLAFVLSNHENSRIQVANEELVMGVRDSAVSEEEFEPTASSPLEVSMKARFVNQDSLYVFTRSEGSTAVGGYRSANEVRVELDMAAKALRIYESQGGSLSIIGQQANLDLPMHEDLDVTLVDDGTTVTVTVGQYTVSGETTGSYSGFKTGVSNWSGRTVVDDYRIAYSPAAEEGGSQLQLMQAQIAVSAELTAQLQEEAVILETELAQESAVLLTSVSVRNQELSRIQGVQLFERSSFYVHGNEIEPILQRTLPHIFPENLQAYIEEQAVLLNEEPGHIQDRILMQQSDYRSIARGLLGYYENAMGDLLNASVDMSARVTAGESEHDLMEALRYQRAIAGNGRYLTEIAFYGIHLPTAEELYQEGRQLFGQEHDLLTKIQSEQDRLQTIENFRAGNRAWQLAHGVPDLAVLIGADEGSADNGYQGELSEAQQRRLGRAQRLVETAMSSMLDRRIQMRIVPDDMVIEDRLRYGGNGITYFDVHADEQETAVRGVTGVIQGNLTSVEGAAEGITASGATFLQTARVQFSEGTDISNLGLIDTETNLRSTESLHVPQGGESALFFTLTEEKMVNIWMNGMAMRDVSLTLQGGQLPAGGYSSAHEGAAGESVSLRLPSGTYTVSVRDDTNYDGGTMATGNFTVPLELEMKSFHSANIEGRISIAERPVTMPVSMRVADYIQNQDGQLVKNENYDGLDTTKPKVNGLNADKPVWVVVHGRGDREGSSKMNDLAKALSATGRQVVTSDWEDAAKDNGFGFLEGADWIPAVGSWIASQLKAAGFHGEQIRIAGHSWGSFVAYEIGKNFLGKDGNTENDFGVQSIVALDSAKDPLPVNSYPASEVSFADVSKASWALKSSFFGSSARANSADVSFDLVIPSELQEQNNPFLIPTQKALLDAAQAYLNEHGYAVSCFANLIRAQGEEGFAALNITDLEAGTLPAIPLNAGDADGHMFLDFVQVTDETGTWWQAVPKTLQIP